ncbi:hypothetical protein C8R44DRAFT_637852, partial [Mycena epipterygia]
MTSIHKTAVDMPLRHSKDAPKTFKGKYSEVDAFLRHYDRLLRKNNVTDPKEQCELVIDYCSTRVAEYVKSEEHYTTPNWPKLRAEIRNYYDAEKVDQRYLPADLSAFTRRSVRKAFHTMNQWKTYYRRYKAIAGNMGKNKLPDDKIAGYFWLGIHPTLRRELYTGIKALDPKRDTSQAPSMAQVKAAAEEYFKRDQFPATLLDARDYGYYGIENSDSSESDSNSDSSTDYEDSDEQDSDKESGVKWKRKFKEKAVERRKKSRDKTVRKDHGKHGKTKEEPETTRDLDRTTKFDKGTTEVEEIIERLNTMNIRDPHYGAVYFKAIKMD